MRHQFDRCGILGHAMHCIANRHAILALVIGLCMPGSAAHAQDQVLIFSAMGDVPYSSTEVPILQRQIRDHNTYSPSEFMVHVGDIKSGASSCTETVYSAMVGYLHVLAVPTYIIPGDNETTDCSNPSQAWTYWTRYFTDFEAGYCGTPATVHQSVRHENWAFISKGVLCMGIDLPSPPSSVNQTVWNAMLQQDADWVSQQLHDHGGAVRAAVLFSQDGPGDSHQNLFFTQFRAAAATFAKPVLLLHGDDHVWKLDHPFAESNILRCCVNNGGDEDPVQVTVGLDSRNPFAFLRNPWSNNPVVFDAPPCVDAGPDLAVTLPAAASLNARASDDGDPVPPGVLTLGWTMTSGPAPVVFADPTARATTANFSAPGNYVLRLTANDGHTQPWDELAVTVTGGSGPTISIADARLTEGNIGSVDLVFAVTLSNGTGGTIDVPWSTAPGTADAGVDYTPESGTLHLTGTSDSQTIHVPVTGDTAVELDETVFVDLASASAGTIVRARGVGTIVNDDSVVLPPPPPPGGGIVTYTPVQDSKVNSSSSSSTYGASTTLRVKTDSDTYESFLKFEVTSLAGPVQSAVLRLYCTDASDNAGLVYRVADTYRGTTTTWVESGINFKNAPLFSGAPLNTPVAAPVNAWVSFDVTATVTANGTYSFGIHNPSGNSAYYSSKEGAHPPQLVVTSGTALVTASAAGAGSQPSAKAMLPQQLELGRGFPNPTRGPTTIEFSLPRPAAVTVLVFDVRGRRIRRIDAGTQSSGRHEFTWDGNDATGHQVGSGVYYVHVQADGETAQERVTVLR